MTTWGASCAAGPIPQSANSSVAQVISNEALELRQNYFSQDTIRHAFPYGRPLEDVEHDLRMGRLDHPPGTLQVVFCDG